MSSTRRLIVGLGTLLLTAMGFVESAGAEVILTDPLTIQQIISSGGGLVVGDKLFEFPNDGSAVVSVATGDTIAPEENGILVTGILSDEGDFGLKFNGGWSAAVNQTVNTTITFKVTVLDTRFLIHDNALLMTAFAVDRGNPQNVLINNPIVSINETVYNVPPDQAEAENIVADKLVRWLGLGHPSNQIFDDEVYSQPLPMVWVEKQIIVSGGLTESTPVAVAPHAHLSEFYQTFSQTDSDIPEPASLALLGLGGVTLLWHSRRRA